MNLENVFKNLIIIEFIILAFAIISGFFVDVGYIDPNAAWTMEDTLGVWALVFVLIYGINLYFLYKFRPIGKTLYVPLIILGFVIGTFVEMEQFSKLDLFLEWFAGLITGLVIALLYLTEIKDKFNK
jgi:hypothetical protein